jgi:transcriptional regulator with XRE-family HTH domain
VEKARVLKELIEKRGISKRAFADEIGLPPTTLQSMLERGVGKASIDNVIKVCRGLGITTEQLETMSKHTDLKFELNKRDERDIAIDLLRIMNNLESNEALAYNGEELEIDEEGKELLRNALEQSMRIAKQMAKKKFTPNKYK